MWRVGRHQPRNIYYDNNVVAVTVGSDNHSAIHAAIICATLNKHEAEVFKSKKPKLGDTVLYKLSTYDVDLINRIRDTKGAHGYQANDVHAGQTYPATIVRLFSSADSEVGTVEDNQGTVNLQVNLDGDDNYWATSRTIGEADGTYSVE
jgi:hypothetical protein